MISHSYNIFLSRCFIISTFFCSPIVHGSASEEESVSVEDVLAAWF
jgi:hypothetical protein